LNLKLKPLFEKKELYMGEYMKLLGLILSMCVSIFAHAKIPTAISCTGFYINSAPILISNDPKYLEFGDLAMVIIPTQALGDSSLNDIYKFESKNGNTYTLSTLNFEGRVSAKYPGNRMLKIEPNGKAVFFNVREDGKLVPVTQNLVCK
jgi:hypothetical protein